jgi:hypothetical protein
MLLMGAMIIYLDEVVLSPARICTAEENARSWTEPGS